jgi:hypothetical protein
MDINNTDPNTDLNAQFPELQDPEGTLLRIAEAFVAPEYARAAFSLMRSVVHRFGDRARFGLSTVITAPQEYENLIMTISKWWFFNFHIAEAEALEEGDDVESLVPLDYDTVLDRESDEESDEEEEAEEGEWDRNGHTVEGEDDDEIVEATFYQVGTFLLDSTIIPHETIFDREDLDCYAYDYPEERIEAERFYWARMVWEPEDLSNEDFLTAVYSTAEFLLTGFGTDMPYAEHHSSDFSQLVLNESLCERAIGATDFGDVIVIEGENE